MGCKASKNFNTLPQIEHNFSPTGNPNLDAYFKKASDLLQKTETLRQQMFVSKQKGVVLAGTAFSLESPYTKAVEVLFWALSAAKQGSIMKARVVTTENQPPFAVLHTQDYCRETLDLFSTLQQYLLILMETPESLQNLVHAFQKLKDEQIEIKKGIDPKIAPKENKIIETNMKKLTDGITTSAKVLGQVQEEQRNASELIKFIPSLMNTADAVGMKASAAGLVRPAEIFKMVENERKKLESEKKKSEKNSEKANKGSAKIGNEVESGDPAQKTDLSTLEVKPNNNQNNHIINAESIPIGHPTNYHQYQPNNGVNQNDSVHAPSFGEVKYGQPAQNPHNDGRVHPQGKLSFDPNQQDGNIPINESNGIYGHMQQRQNEGEKAVHSENLEKAQSEKKKILVLSDEVTTEIPQVNEGTRVKGPGPGYLSPGGSKQAGILQGAENIVDAEEIRHALANESNALKGFAVKARSYLDSKD